MGRQQGSTQTILPILLGVAALIALVLFFGPEPDPQAKQSSITKTTPKPPTSNQENLSATQKLEADTLKRLPSGAKLVTGTAENPPEGLPEDLRKALQNQNPQLPPDIQAQINAAPPELPDDLRRQLNNQPTELPEDLKRQLNSPPPPIPDDIRRALETPPREVTIDEVNTPVDAR